MTGYRKKLIEVAVPLIAINDASSGDVNRKTGHIRNLHKWFAPMPLPAWRAMLLAAVVDDPSNDLAEPDATAARQQLFRLIERIAPLDAHKDPGLMDEARRLVQRACGDAGPPTVLDPFCGGGSTIVEAQRLGFATEASDLNPVPLLITTALTRIPPIVRGRGPVNPQSLSLATGGGLSGFVADVRHYAEVVRERAWAHLSEHYPEAEGGGVVFAWRWAWHVKSPHPAAHGGYTPLVNDWLFAKTKGTGFWIAPEIDTKAAMINYSVKAGGGTQASSADEGGVTCLFTREPIELDHLRTEGAAGRLRPRLLGMAVTKGKHRLFVSPTPGHQAAAASAKCEMDAAEIPDGALGFRVKAYGIGDYAALYTDRQRLALATFCDVVAGLHTEVTTAARARFENGDDDTTLANGGTGAQAYADAVITVLGLCVSKMAQANNILVRWFVDARSGGGWSIPAFGQPVVPFVRDFVETNPFGGSGGDWMEVVGTALRAFPLVELGGVPARVTQRDARVAAESATRETLVATDPPYYDNIGYADLADVFYLFLRRALRGVHPRIFTTAATPKSAELIADASRHGGSEEAANEFFRSGFRDVFGDLATATRTTYPMLIVYAMKQNEGGAKGATGWEVFLQGLVDAGLMVVATWPVRTVKATRMRSLNSNALASAVFVVCRRRPDDADAASLGDFQRELRVELPAALSALQSSSIAPVDLAQAAIGPAIAIFSRHSRVVGGDGRSLRVRDALALIVGVLDEHLAGSEVDYDADTRWAITWFEQRGYDEGPYGDAETLAKARNVAVSGIAQAGIIKSAAGKVRLLKRAELRPLDYEPAKDDRPTVWEYTQHLIRNLEEDGEEAAGALLKMLGTHAETARALAYRLFNACERRKWAEEARSYNGLVVAWPELEKIAAGARVEKKQTDLDLDEDS